MKSVLIFFALSMLIAENSFAGINCYQCYQVNTKPWGCNRVEHSVPEPNAYGGNNYKVRCIDPGETPCQFSDGTCPLVVEDAIETIEANIYNNTIMTGNVLTSWGSYSWTGTDPDNFEYTINFNF